MKPYAVQVVVQTSVITLFLGAVRRKVAANAELRLRRFGASESLARAPRRKEALCAFASPAGGLPHSRRRHRW